MLRKGEYRGVRQGAGLVLLACLQACAGKPSLVQLPTDNRPVMSRASVERQTNPGAIFQAASPGGMQMLQGDTKPRYVGDSLKIEISESLTASQKVKTNTSRDNQVATKGPGGADTMSSLINRIINADYSASGSDSFDGSGTTETTNKLSGKLAASVINVLPNGNLVVAGEKSIAFNGSVNTLRFSGVVDPIDIKSGRIVASGDVMDARLEQVGVGLITDTTDRSWLQRMLTDSLTLW
ncbi:MAG: flagellar biosynthesis protein FlgH [Candidatus Dactylopiibacterium carminicum]|uniref:Flagellar biosynthesis protein FlgH n=1 Tax=Candidatus Dactylopiibacterium carminicum TaxID=857335 RepID=A0A272EX37_9RHOO|nr:flagellar basal body L-ring protein FlgH [Candidatus Dactylopiibacterium carminicum]KAF7600279.1 flagellar biosynthesis protein FlgH [Candidatus Dactylopiibacterium carminicum]PAS94669.1 MAG: flagellar biosynthesis protein FlgH [Candidatus Dactylopiibacterium carminicum]PAS96956.1 MAG: flagellar biosynthesis protein FlgH [Candidatus Dactylopiibacterium carminicum]PAT00278.1 MAG: flagellar biosynthesis protein FlgH [Candidatus Dactylopiibacterium carminicum]